MLQYGKKSALSMPWDMTAAGCSYLTTMFNSTGWDYVETTINGQTARGFIPSGYLSNTSEQLDETGLDGIDADEESNG